VRLVSVLQLEHSTADGKYYIAGQKDLYQVNEFVKFVWPGGAVVVWLWQCFATLVCVVGALVLAPVTWLEERGEGRGVVTNGI
jgi:hypothetical protein